ncbi:MULTISPECIES: RsfA family transcriptional regulator [unclassified Bacillus (in: firmicutes)]|uniref:RsfA family transcriptional regulator n=1 Tax=Bacillus bruguierae TaxID=3127667 RepID=A0ABU8FCG3_9BACI|nr:MULTISPECIES: RsfA family transcriptional regulator [unclassified Bacillus (in: firmicutes)]SFJ37911.1 transcription factor, RsfA family [Bacillus sp. 71mf]SFS52120.1 transcription factor, RsfA family [Bacillus sp. 103mf]
MKMRQDAWTGEEDLLLAETVLRHIREGSTQLKAFDEVGDQLNRTSAACGFRWNAEVRQSYEEAVQIARKQRKELKREQAVKPKTQVSRVEPKKKVVIEAEFSEDVIATEPSLTMQDIISFLQNIEQNNPHIEKLQTENETLHSQLETLQKINHQLEKKLEALQKQQQSVQEDYETLVRIMDRARKLVLLDEPKEQMAPIFKMDQNGNLDIVSQ